MLLSACSGPNSAGRVMGVKYIEQDGLMRYSYRSSFGVKGTSSKVAFNLFGGCTYCPLPLDTNMDGLMIFLLTCR